MVKDQEHIKDDTRFCPLVNFCVSTYPGDLKWGVHYVEYCSFKLMLVTILNFL